MCAHRFQFGETGPTVNLGLVFFFSPLLTIVLWGGSFTSVRITDDSWAILSEIAECRLFALK